MMTAGEQGTLAYVSGTVVRLLGGVMFSKKGNGEPRPGNGVAVLSRHWRGSPELLAHAMRVLHDVTSGEPPSQATLSIDVRVANDHECFISADSFVQMVSLEAMRNFDSIHFESSSELRQAGLDIRWQRSRWSTGKGPDAVVELHITGSDPGWVETARPRIVAAISRGYAGRLNTPARQFLTGALISLAAWGLWFVLAFLFPALSLEKLAFSPVLVLIPLLFFGYFLGKWMVPSLEIVPEGGSNAWRGLKKIGPVVVTILLAGLTKQLFGS